MASASQLILKNAIRVHSSQSDPNHIMVHANCSLMDLAVDQCGLLDYESRRKRWALSHCDSIAPRQALSPRRLQAFTRLSRF
jgi:hypothetical protein